MNKIPQPGLPELRRIRQLEEAIKVLMLYCHPSDNETRFKIAVNTAKKLLSNE